jgi:predicted RNA-binding Zn ribbon-like protein
MISGLDEGVLMRERGLPQPGGRRPAPGDLVLLQSFLNTHFDLVGVWGADLLARPEPLRSWFASRGLVSDGTRRPSPAELQRVIAVREGLRELARRNREPNVAHDPATLARMNEATAMVSLGLQLGPERLVLSSRGEGNIDVAVGTLLVIAVQAMIDGRWRRLKACPGDHCGWVFYDHSRNNSSRWCSMAVCGGRTKARSRYRRQRMRSVGDR